MNDRLYELLPAAVRLRDEVGGGALRELLSVIGEQVGVVEDDIAGLYENWFVETSADWVVPYLGDLLGYSAAEAGTAAPAGALSRRREVAGLIAAHRRKGTLALLEELAGQVAGWPARAVEFAPLLALFTHRSLVLDCHDPEPLDRLGGPFEQTAHVADVRRVTAPVSPGRYNIPEVGVFVWRLRTYPVTRSPAACVEEESPSSFTFSVLGNDAPLFTAPDPEPDEWSIAGEANLPIPIRRRALAADVAARYGPDRSFAVEIGVRSHGRVVRRAVPASSVVVADLTGWRYQPADGTVAVDPVLGRLAFPPGRPPVRVWTSYRYGFSADIGAGEYPRRLAGPGEGTFYQAVRKPVGGRRDPKGPVAGIAEALEQWQAVRDEQPIALIEILDSEVYSEQLEIVLRHGELLEIRAADRTRPVIQLLDRQRDASDALIIRADHEAGRYDDEHEDDGDDHDDEKPAARPAPGGCVRLDGLLITGRAVHVEGPLRRVEIVGCTLVPGWGLANDCSPSRPSEPSLEIYRTGALVRVERSVLGSIEVYQDDEPAGRRRGKPRRHRDPVRLELSDCVLDATSDSRSALGGPSWPTAHATARLRNCTVFGTVHTHQLTLAENCVFTGPVRVSRRQIGCLRYCYVAPGSRTPRRYRCQPDLAVTAGSALDEARVRPHFDSHRYGNPGYARLSAGCADEIVRGADDESELGAFHDLYQPQRLALLRARLAQFSPARADVAVLLEN